MSPGASRAKASSGQRLRKDSNRMARFSRLAVLNTIIDDGLVPVFYNADVEVARNVVRACAAGGARVAEKNGVSKSFP